MGPSVCLTFLGIEINSQNMEMRLPADKLAWLKGTIQQWRGSKNCTKHDLLSLTGQLGHACKVVKPGRIFLSQMIKLLTVAKQLDHHIRLNHAFRADLEWCNLYLVQWNGVSLPWNEDTASVLELRGLLGNTLVSAPMARLSAQSSYHHQGADSSSGNSCSVGSTVVSFACESQV